MKRLWILLASVLMTTPAMANNSGPFADPDFAPRGANIGQQQVYMAWLLLKPFLQACAYSDDCGLSEKESTLVRGAAHSIKAYSQDSIVFKSERENPGLFKSSQGELHRLVVTGDTPNSPIFVNSDLVPAQIKPPEFAKWMGILAHEFMHHQGFKDDASRIPDQFGSKIAKSAESFLARRDVSETDGEVQIWILNFPQPKYLDVFDAFPQGLSPRAILVQSDRLYNMEHLANEMHFKTACQADQTYISTQLNVYNLLQTPADQRRMRNFTVLYHGIVSCLSQDKSKMSQENRLYEIIIEYKDEPGSYEINTQEILSGPATGDSTDGSESRIAIQDIVLLTPQVRAGETALWRVRLQDLGLPKKMIACGGNLTRKDWPVFGAGVPLPLYVSRCRVLSHIDDMYEIEMELETSKNAEPGPLIIERVGLMPTATPVEGEFFATTPEKLTEIEILNEKQAPLKITQVEITGAKAMKVKPPFVKWYHVPRGSTFTFVIEFKGMIEDLDQAYFSSTLRNSDDRPYTLSGPLISPMDGNFLVQATRVKRTAENVRYEFDIYLPPETDAGLTKSFKFDDLIFLTKDLKVVRLEIPETEIGVVFSEYIETESR